jgi:CelD/BcsL family acetyltransferase involved in cellulose biosynthesis
MIRDWPGVCTLEGEWNGLLRQSAADSIFLTWEWVRTWLEAVDESVQPLVVAVRDGDGRLVGLGPFYRSRLRLAGLVTYRALRVLGDEPTGAEYPDWIALGEREGEIHRAMAGALVRNDADWDCIWMPRMSGWSGAGDRIRQAGRAAGLHCQDRPRAFSAIALPPTFAEYMSRLSAKTRKNVRRETDRILRRPGVRIVRCQSRADIERFLEALFRLHHDRWARKGDQGTFRRNPAAARFYEGFAPLALANGWLRIYGLEQDGDLKAVQIGYVYGRVFHALQEGFDPSYEAGAGNVLRALVLESCIAEGLRSYDFLAGVTSHKQRWMATPRDGYDVFVGRRSVRNALLFWPHVWPSGRYLRPSQTA